MNIAQKLLTNNRFASSTTSSSVYWTFQRYNEWMNVGIVKKKGRAFDASVELIPANLSATFPTVPCTSLYGEPNDFPNDSKPQIRLVAFSFKQYGFTLTKSFLDPFKAKFIHSSSVGFAEICYVEHGFLSIARGMFISNLKKILPPDQHTCTFITFGNVKNFAQELDLPNFFTGYAYLLDSKNRIRWKGCGMSKPEEIENLYRCTETLVQEEMSKR